MSENGLAYIVSLDDDYEPNACIVFEESYRQARREGASIIAEGVWRSVTCCRAPKYDQWAPGPVPLRVLLEDGWYFDCCGCGDRVAEYHPHALRTNDDLVFCGHWCRLRYLSEQGRHTAKLRIAAWLASQHIPPFATVVAGLVMGDGVLAADVTFPGARHRATWRADRPGILFVCKGDLPAYQAQQAEVTEGE